MKQTSKAGKAVGIVYLKYIVDSTVELKVFCELVICDRYDSCNMEKSLSQSALASI